MPGPRLAAALLVPLSLFARSAVAQQDPPKPPRIGLVLSGGGARGAAHVGVLQVLEELRVPVHCVVGTSMGSIVGGLYAYGHSPEELQRLLTREGHERGWDWLLSDGDGRQALEFRRKEETRLMTGRLKFGLIGFSLQLPKGFIQGQNLETELRRLSREAHELPSFDQLKLPFRCVAVDIGTGEQVVLDRGNLAMAMRASMSLPGVFAPAVVDGRELLDGGLVDNVPVDVARQFGCDVLIVVDIGTPPKTADQIRDVLDVSSQMVALLTQQNVDRSLQSLGPDDLLIQPKLGDISSADFLRAAETIAIGRAATEAVAERLRRYAVDAGTWQRHLAAQRRAPLPPPVVRNVTIDNQSGMTDAVVRARLDIETGTPLDDERLLAGMSRLYGSDDLQRVGFALRDWREGAADLDIRVEDKGWGIDTLQIGLLLESDFDEASGYRLGVMHVAKRLNGFGAELRTSVEIGSQTALGSEYYQPLFRDGSFFIAPRVVGADTRADAYNGTQRVASGHVTYGAIGIDLGVLLWDWGEFRTGWVRATGDVDIELTSIGVPGPEVEFDDSVLRSLLRVDTLDDGFFPRTGMASAAQYSVGVEDLGADAEYQALALGHTQAVSAGDLTFIGILAYDTTLSDNRPFYAQPSLGGFLKLSGLPANSITGEHMALATLMLRYQIAEGVVPFYVGASAELGNVWLTRDDQFEEWIVGGSAFVALDTPLGPLNLGLGVAEDGARTGFLFLGPPR